MSTTLGPGLINPALRIAGITGRPGRTPSPDQSTECIAIINRMISSWNCERLNIYSTSLDRYALKPIQTTYFIGPTGDFVAPRPIRIIRANAVVTLSSPELHRPMAILDDVGWAAKRIPELQAAAWPTEIYNDYDMPDSKLYLYPLFSQVCDLELFTWKALNAGGQFVNLTDSVVLPDGYEDAIVWNAAVRIAQYYPRESALAPDAPRFAGETLAAIQNVNAPVPTLANDAANTGRSDHRRSSDTNWWRSGGYGI